ncbi:MAG: archaeosortase/exosortase family protein [Chloroflexi bacterium]|nr:archaeosortase/exosortase family protein [Chloroflexota bacterium]
MKLIRRTNSTARFCIYFFVSILISIVVYVWLRNSSAIEPFLGFNAQLATDIWNLFDNSAIVTNTAISSSDFNFEVTAECTSIGPTAIFTSAVIAWPSTIKEKIKGIIVGAAALFIINLIRILTLFYIGSHFPNQLDLFHYYIWQGIIVLLALGLWVFWMDKMVQSPLPGISDNQAQAT